MLLTSPPRLISAPTLLSLRLLLLVLHDRIVAAVTLIGRLLLLLFIIGGCMHVFGVVLRVGDAAALGGSGAGCFFGDGEDLSVGIGFCGGHGFVFIREIVVLPLASGLAAGGSALGAGLAVWGGETGVDEVGISDWWGLGRGHAFVGEFSFNASD
jgi:hypothetical protein